MGAAEPVVVVGVLPLDVHNGVVQIKVGGIVVVVAVLIVNAEEEAQLVASLLQSLHAGRTARGLVDGEGLGMEVIVAVVTPAVQMEVGLFHAVGLQLPQILCRGGKGIVAVIVLGVIGIVEMGGGVDVHRGAGMDDGTADEVLHAGIAVDLFLQGDQLAPLGQVAAVDLGHGIEVTLGEEGVDQGARVGHSSQGGGKVGLDLLPHHAVAGIVGGIDDGGIAAAVVDLTVDGNVGAALKDDAVVELEIMSRREDCTLHTGQDGIAVTLGGIKFHAGRVGQGGQLALIVSQHAGRRLELTCSHIQGYLGLYRNGGGVAFAVAEILVGGADTAGGASVKGMALAIAIGQGQRGLIRPHQEGDGMPAPGDIRTLDRDGQRAGLGGIGYRKQIVREGIVHGVSSLSIR